MTPENKDFPEVVNKNISKVYGGTWLKVPDRAACAQIMDPKKAAGLSAFFKEHEVAHEVHEFTDGPIDLGGKVEFIIDRPSEALEFADIYTRKIPDSLAQGIRIHGTASERARHQKS